MTPVELDGGRIDDVKTNKEPVLRTSGYTYNFDRMVYMNRAKRKAFSVEWIEDHSEQELREKMAEPNSSGKWQLYFNSNPSDAVLRDFLAELG